MSFIQKRGKNTSWRQGLMRNLATELMVHERLLLTERRAKELRTIADKLITLAKRQDLHARRQAAAILRNVDVKETETVLQKLFSDIAKRYKDRDGGYTRLLKTEDRRGDNAPMVFIELV